MRKLETTLAVVSAIAVVLKILHIPLAGILTMIVLPVFSILYYPFGFLTLNNIRFRDIFKKSAYQGISPLRIMGTIFVGMSLPSLIYGILFKVFSYEGAGTMLITGLICLFITTIVATVKYVKTHSQFYVEILVRIAIMGGLGLLFLLLF